MAGVRCGVYEQVELGIHCTIFLHDTTKVTSGGGKKNMSRP